MALPASGLISLGNVRTELSGSGVISLNDANVRNMLGKPSGLIRLSDGYGKSSFGFSYQGGLKATAWGTGNVNGAVWGNSMFVVVGDGGRIATSADGITWTFIPSSSISGISSTDLSNTTWLGVAWNGSKFVACGSGARIATSTNGTTWAYQGGLASSSGWSNYYGYGSIATANSIASNGSVFVVVGSAGLGSISTDGITWTTIYPVYLGIYGALTQVIWAGANFLSVGSYKSVAVSTDGSTWTGNNFTTGVSGDDPLVATWGSSKYILSSSGGYISTSTDGATWTDQGQLLTSDCTRLLNGGLKTIAVLSNGVYATSSNGLTWVESNVLQSTAWGYKGASDGAWNGSKFLIVSTGGDVATAQ